MTWWMFGLIVSGLLTLLLVLVALPWWRSKNDEVTNQLSNAQIVNQRLTELEREVREGLITESDKQQVSDDLKIALVEETSIHSSRRVESNWPVVIGAMFALIVGGVVYWQVNHLTEVEQATHALARLPELSSKLASGDGNNINVQDIQALTLAIRTRLIDEPEDEQGWMFLGRLWLAIGQDEQARAALEKAIEIDPKNSTIVMTYAQILMASESINDLKHAQKLLLSLIQQQPDNDNLMLMTAVVSSQVNDMATAKLYFDKIRTKLPKDNPLYVQLSSKIEAAQLPLKADKDLAKTGFAITLTLDEGLLDKVPDKGFLFLYAQDATSDNKMPAAVVKVPLTEFPITLALTTENAMLPSYTLAQLKQTRLTARITRNDNATPQSGDLVGTVSLPVVVGEIRDQLVVISKEIM